MSEIDRDEFERRQQRQQTQLERIAANYQKLSDELTRLEDEIPEIEALSARNADLTRKKPR